MYITTCGGLPDSIIARGVENTSGFSGDCWTGGDHPDQTIDLTGLPVTWNFIDAESEDNHVVLYWGTSMELNNSHFLIRRSRDEITWQTIGRVEGTNIRQGFSGYRYFDMQPSPGLNYFRIIQVDQDGRNTESAVLAVTFEGDAFSFIGRISPNPAGETASVSLFSAGNDEFEMQVLDISGKVLFSERMMAQKGMNDLSIPTNLLENGLFFVRFTNNDLNLVAKFISRK